MKFSIIVPVYNVRDYIGKCLDSIIKQTYDNFEIIVVNDGSSDDSQSIIDEYIKKDKRIKSYKKANGGLSDARNYGLKYITGDYLLFIDSDDYIREKLLERLNEVLSAKQVDLVRFECDLYDEQGKMIASNKGVNYCDMQVDDSIEELVIRKYVENAWLYCYNVNFWKKNNFKYAKGKIHEDFGLTPVILYCANTISSIDYSGYCYLIRAGSITNSKNYEKIKKGVYDMGELGKKINIYFQDKDCSFKKKVILSYVNESLVVKALELKPEDRDKYYKLLKDIKVAKNISAYNFKKLVKKIIISFSFDLYLKVFRG